MTSIELSNLYLPEKKNWNKQPYHLTLKLTDRNIIWSINLKLATTFNTSLEVSGDQVSQGMRRKKTFLDGSRRRKVVVPNIIAWGQKPILFLLFLEIYNVSCDGQHCFHATRNLIWPYLCRFIACFYQPIVKIHSQFVFP